MLSIAGAVGDRQYSRNTWDGYSYPANPNLCRNPCSTPKFRFKTCESWQKDANEPCSSSMFLFQLPELLYPNPAQIDSVPGLMLRLFGTESFKHLRNIASPSPCRWLQCFGQAGSVGQLDPQALRCQFVGSASNMDI